MRARLVRARKDLEAEAGGDIETIINELADRYI